MLPALLTTALPAATRIQILALVLLALAAAAGLGAVAGYRHGLDVERGRHARSQAVTLERTAQDARAHAAAESDRRQATALHHASAAAAAGAARLDGQTHALQTARPDDPHWAADRLVRIDAALAIANGTPAPAGSLPRAVSAAAQSARPHPAKPATDRPAP